MSYHDRLLAHLTNYRRTVLGITEPGVFAYRGKPIERDHILHVDSADKNLLPEVRSLEADYRAANPNVRRHRYFHHLNSSQAFAFNLFLPFFGRGPNTAEALLRAFGQRGPLESFKLESLPEKDEGTNIDAVWIAARRTTICEVKLSETEFGTAPADCRHRDKLTRMYAPVLRPHVDPELLDEPEFFGAYQVLRNVWHLVRDDKAELVFLMPRANAKLWNALPPVLDRIVSSTRLRIRQIAIEDVLTQLVADPASTNDLRGYAVALSAKYLPV